MLRCFYPFLLGLAFLTSSYAQIDSCAISLRDSTHDHFDADSLLRHADKFLGIPYRYSGKSPKRGFDCAGFVCYNYKKFGVQLPYSSIEQIKVGNKIERDSAKAGDLIFFKGRNHKSKTAGHVGIVVEVRDTHILFIHSAVTGGVRYDKTNSDYYKKRFIGIRRVKS